MMDILSLQFLWALLAIILIDVVLGGENAIVIALAARQLPEHLRQRAMIWGTVGAVAVRFICVAILTYLLAIPGLRVVGGLLLVWIAWRLTADDDSTPDVKASVTIWGALGTIIMADAVMGLDNALGIAAAAGGSWVLIITGLVFSVPIILFGSTVISRILERYPHAVYLGSFVLYVVAAKMIMGEPTVAEYIQPIHDYSKLALPWLTALVITANQYARNVKFK